MLPTFEFSLGLSPTLVRRLLCDEDQQALSLMVWLQGVREEVDVLHKEMQCEAGKAVRRAEEQTADI